MSRGLLGQGVFNSDRKEEEARKKTEGREEPFIPIIGRAVLAGDDGVRGAGGWGQHVFAKQ